MSKVVILGDTHIGIRSDNIAFHDYARKFYENVFFPYLEKHDIKHVIQTGDLFDRRKFINFNTLHLAREYFFSKFTASSRNYVRLYTYVGNHDVYFRNTLKVNSLKLLCNEYPIEVIDSPRKLVFYGLEVDIIPWICEENEQEVKDFIEKSNSKVCFGHFELNGFEMDRGNVCNEGMDRNLLSKYDMVISGHFHHKSSDGHIFYVGSPMEFTWADHGDKRGFHVFDTETLELEFIQNPYSMFHKITYDDRVDTLESITEQDFSVYANTMVKVVVVNKDNTVLFDHFMDSLYKIQPLDVTIVENFSELSDFTEEESVDQSETTTQILYRYVDSIDIGLNKDKMKNLLTDVYTRALDKEQHDII